MTIEWKTSRDKDTIYYWFCLGDDQHVLWIRKNTGEKCYKWGFSREDCDEGPDEVIASGEEKFLVHAKRRCLEALEAFKSQ